MTYMAKTTTFRVYQLYKTLHSALTCVEFVMESKGYRDSYFVWRGVQGLFQSIATSTSPNHF